MKNNQVLSTPFFETSEKSSAKQLAIHVTPGSLNPSSPPHRLSAISRVVPISNMCRYVWLIIIAGLGPAYVGYLLYIGLMGSYQSYQTVYRIPLDISSQLGIVMLLAVVPLGGVFSSLFLPDMLKLVNKRSIVYVFFVVSVVFSLITCVPNFIALMIGRFGLGLMCSWQNTIGAVLMRDMSPLQYRSPSTAFFFTARTFGMALCFLFAALFKDNFDYTLFCVFGCVPAMISLIQVICVQVFIPILPTQLVAQKSQEGLKKYYSDLYAPQHVNQAAQNCMNQFNSMDKQFPQVHKGKTELEKEIALTFYKKIQDKALFASLYATAIRQFCGINYVVFYGKFIFINLGFQNIDYVGHFLMSLIQFVFTLLGLFIFYKFSRRSVYLVGGAVCIAAGLTMAVCDILQVYLGVFIGQIIYIVFMAITINPVVWPYPIQVILPSLGKWSSFVNWLTGFLITIVPVRNVSYQFFFAITAFLILSEILCYFFLYESKDMTLREVFTKFMEEAYIEQKKVNVELRSIKDKKGIQNQLQ